MLGSTHKHFTQVVKQVVCTFKELFRLFNVELEVLNFEVFGG